MIRCYQCGAQSGAAAYCSERCQLAYEVRISLQSCMWVRLSPGIPRYTHKGRRYVSGQWYKLNPINAIELVTYRDALDGGYVFAVHTDAEMARKFSRERDWS